MQSKKNWLHFECAKPDSEIENSVGGNTCNSSFQAAQFLQLELRAARMAQVRQVTSNKRGKAISVSANNDSMTAVATHGRRFYISSSSSRVKTIRQHSATTANSKKRKPPRRKCETKNLPSFAMVRHRYLTNIIVFGVTAITLLSITTSLLLSMAATVDAASAIAHRRPPAGVVNGEQLTMAKKLTAHFAETETANNVQRVAVGRPVKFKCVVNNIGDHKVAWFHKEKRLLLAFDNKTVAWKERIHVSSQANSVFFLQIDSVQLGDKGQITCQLSTQPAQSQIHILDVVQSPQIKEQETTVNIEPVKEFSSVELRCAADGVPKPVIKWRRESQMHVIPTHEEASADQLDEEGGAGDEQQEQASDNSSANERPQVASPAPKRGEDDSASENDVSSDVQATRHQQQQERAGTVADRPSSAQPAAPAAPESKVVPAQALTEATQSSRNNADHSTADGNRLHNANQLQLNSSQQTDRSTTSSIDAAAAASPIAAAADSTRANKLFMAEGEVLRFDRVSRHDMGFYMCIASNGVSPSVSQRIFLPVSFVPKPTRAPARTEARSDERDFDGTLAGGNSLFSSASPSSSRVEALRDGDGSHIATAATSGSRAANAHARSGQTQRPPTSSSKWHRQRTGKTISTRVEVLFTR